MIYLFILVVLFILYYFDYHKKIFVILFLKELRDLQLKTGRVYSYFIVKNDFNEIKKININLKNKNNKIPKIIHQIWIGPKNKPWEWINSFKIDFMNKYKGWTYYLWTEEEINKLNLINKKAYDCEKTYNGKSDILRYELLNKFGGIYIDADSYWLGLDLEDLINQTNYTGFFVARESLETKYSLAGGVMGSSKNNPIISYMIYILGKNYFKHNKYSTVKSNYSYKTIGPYFLDQALAYFDVTVFPHFYFYPIYWHGKNSIEMKIEDQKKKFPDSYMTQFGFTTNNL